MGNSNIALSRMFDVVAARGIFDPRTGPSGFGDALAFDCADGVIADLITPRFNWKFNSAVAAPFYTNSWQQDYPQLAQAEGLIGWGEDISCVDINNTQAPKPIAVPIPKWRKNLPRINAFNNYGGGYLGCFRNMCWMYNKDLTVGVWPGASVTFYPLVGINAPAQQNPLLNMLDANGNILIVTTFGTTAAPLNILTSAFSASGSVQSIVYTFTGTEVITIGNKIPVQGTNNSSINGNSWPVTASSAGSVTITIGSGSVNSAPAAQTGTIDNPACAPGGTTAPASAEGFTVTDGTVVWTVVSPTSQGFRIDNLPSSTGTVWQVLPVYQLEPPHFTSYSQKLNPLPDSYSRYFRRGLEYACLEASANPGDGRRQGQTRQEWLESLVKEMRQGERETNAYGVLPAGGVVEQRGPGGSVVTADNPWGTN